MVVCTQPRRVAATSVATRVADEMGSVLGQEVFYFSLPSLCFTSSQSHYKNKKISPNMKYFKQLGGIQCPI